MVDWPTYGYDVQRTGESPDTSITSSNVGNLKVVWSYQGDLPSLNGGEFDLESQPVIATNVPVGGTPKDIVYIGGGSGTVYAFEARTGKKLWTTKLPTGTYTCNGGPGYYGVSGTFAIDRVNGALYVPDGIHKVHALDLATGADRWSVNVVAPGTDDGSDSELRAFVHTGLNLVNGKIYVGTSGVCDITPWRGRVAVVDVATHTLAHTFFTVANETGVPGTFYSGGGVWGWGGVSVDSGGSVYTGVGNADTFAQTSPFVTAPAESSGYAEHIIKLSADLASVADSDLPSTGYPPYPVDATDIDLAGTPVLFQPPGCPQLLAVQGKEGYLFVYDRTNLGKGPIAAAQFSISSDGAYYMGLPSYSKQTGYLYAPISTGSTTTGYAPGLAIMQPNASCAGFSVVAHPAFGPDSTDASLVHENPRSTPTVVNDVVFLGTPNGVLWARNARTGAALWDSASGGAWAANTSGGDELRPGPTVSGGWVYVVATQSASIYALSVNGSATGSALRGALAARGTTLPAAIVKHNYRRKQHRPF